MRKQLNTRFAKISSFRQTNISNYSLGSLFNHQQTNSRLNFGTCLRVEILLSNQFILGSYGLFNIDSKFVIGFKSPKDIIKRYQEIIIQIEAFSLQSKDDKGYKNNCPQIIIK
jgi:hypothetical protein